VQTVTRQGGSPRSTVGHATEFERSEPSLRSQKALAVPTCTAEINSLSLMVQRLLDAELLLDTEGAALLTETRAACRCLEEGYGESVRRHVEQVARFVEGLVATETLDRADGRAVIETAGRILAGDTR
jgi:hypothetical protein